MPADRSPDDTPTETRATPPAREGSGAGDASGQSAANGAPPGEPIPDRISRYRIVRRAGGGGMGEVYQAFDDALERMVAIKVVKLNKRSRELEQQLEHEAIALAKLDHPSLARVTDRGEFGPPEERRRFLAMEWLGESASLCEPGMLARLALRDRVRLLAEAAEGLAHAHAAGVIHADVKPANMLVVERHGRPTVKVVDLGLARFAWGARTAEGLRGGSPPYFSPELRDRDGADPNEASDVFAFGRTIEQVLELSRPRQRTLAGRGLVAIARRATAPLDARTPTMDAVAKALREWLDSPVQGLCFAGRRYGLDRPVRAAGALSLALGILVVATAVPLLFWVIQRVPFSAYIGSRPSRIEHLENTLVIALTDDDADAAFAAAKIPADSLMAGTERRSLHAAMARKLAKAPPRVCLWDIFFYDREGVSPDTQEGAIRARESQRLAGGLEELAEAGTKNVLAHPTWDPSEAQQLIPNSLIYADWRPAAPATACETTTYRLMAPILVKKPDREPQASAALLASALWKYPGYAPRFEFGADGSDVVLIYQRRDGGRTTLRRERLELRDVLLDVESPDLRIDKQDRVGLIPVHAMSDATYAPATIGYAQALLMPPDELAARTRDKVVIIADTRSTPGADPIVSGTESAPLHGCFVQAVAVDVLIGRKLTTVAGWFGVIAASVLGAALGVALLALGAWGYQRTRKERQVAHVWPIAMLISALAGALAGAISVWTCGTLASTGTYFCHPAVPALAAAAGAFAGWLLPRVAAKLASETDPRARVIPGEIVHADYSGRWIVVRAGRAHVGGLRPGKILR